MFGRITKQQVSHHFNKAKNFLGHAYHHTKNFLGDVDQGVRIVKSIYGAVAPILESYGVNTNKKHIMKAVSGYDNIRHNVMEKSRSSCLEYEQSLTQPLTKYPQEVIVYK